MRVLVLTNMYPPHSYGGYEQSCLDVVTRWRSAGHQVEVLTSDLRLPGSAEAPSSATVPRGDSTAPGVRRQLHLYWDDHRIISPSLRTRRTWESDNYRALEQAIDESQPDVVSAWAMGGMSLGLLTRVGQRHLPLVSVICDEWPIYGPEVDAWLRPLFRRRALASAVKAVTGLPTDLPPLDQLGPACFVSDFLRRICRERSSWTFPDSGIVPSGIATDEFPYDAKTTDRPFEWRLLYVGRIDPRKGIDTAIRALAFCPEEATLDVHGDGDPAHRAELKRLVDELGLTQRVTFDAAPRSELAAVYRAADAMLFPSQWEEPFGLVPIEAMACGTPVVAVPSGGSAEFLDDGTNCLTVAGGDPQKMANAIGRLADNPELRKQLVAGGRRTADRYGVDQLAGTLETWHQWAIDPEHHPKPEDRPKPSPEPPPEPPPEPSAEPSAHHDH